MSKNTNLGHQIWCPGDTKFFTVYIYIYIMDAKEYKHVHFSSGSLEEL